MFSKPHNYAIASTIYPGRSKAEQKRKKNINLEKTKKG
jgi:hypothetical protein